MTPWWLVPRPECWAGSYTWLPPPGTCLSQPPRFWAFPCEAGVGTAGKGRVWGVTMLAIVTLESGAGGRFSFGCRGGGGGVTPGQRCLGKGCLPAWKRLEPAWRFSKPARLQESKRVSFLPPLIYHVLPSHAHHAHVAQTTAVFPGSISLVESPGVVTSCTHALVSP